jgi:hypothetical protein
VCIPITEETDRLYQLQLVDDPDLGQVPGWLDITSGVHGNRVCGDVNIAYQTLMWELGYVGYLGIVTVMAQASIPVPATTPWGQLALEALMAAVALFVLRARMEAPSFSAPGLQLSPGGDLGKGHHEKSVVVAVCRTGFHNRPVDVQFCGGWKVRVLSMVAPTRL